ncbi:substrate-binding periplasmic protein [Bermanella sp. WJH001]|uniref:substrate-binding periplasmic protein n=1 Tax=Bermanella sp. WJH001 TaxID=3048005 RepID=UPI0024BDA2AD|nr:ABC transporter substrate-binding protein [Bermanella sp. WJH001]MDJ1537756.1 ABC transporter substrate-binding protein [Bermanella sp. WJH001]
MFFRFSFSCLLWLTCFQLSFASDIKVAVPPSGYPPYIIVDNNNLHGILIETLQKAAKSSSLELEFVYLSEQASQSQLDSNQIDMRMESPGWVDNPERYLWSEPITSIKDMFVFNRNTPNEFESDDALSGAVINTHSGYGYPTLNKLFESRKIIRNDFETEKAMLLDLLNEQNGVKKAAVMDQYVVKYLMSRDSILKESLSLSRRHIDYKYLHFQVLKSRKMHHIITRLNLEIKKLKKIGVIDKIIKRNLSGM